MTEPTEQELLEIGRKVYARQQKQRVQAKEARAIKTKLYKLWKDGSSAPINSVTIE